MDQLLTLRSLLSSDEGVCEATSIYVKFMEIPPQLDVMHPPIDVHINPLNDSSFERLSTRHHPRGHSVRSIHDPRY